MGEPRSTYQFGPFSLQVDRRRLLRDGDLVALSPKALETLLALVEQRDRVLTKDELLQRIWGDTVVEEGGLARNISVLRKALGESPDDHRYDRDGARARVSLRPRMSRRGRRAADGCAGGRPGTRHAARTAHPRAAAGRGGVAWVPQPRSSLPRALIYVLALAAANATDGRRSPRWRCCR
jgi:hypothetical protein